MSSPRQIFGRQPVVIVAFIQSVILLLAAFGLLAPIGINTAEDVTYMAAVLNGLAAVYLALGTTETLLAAAVELAKAVFALLTFLGADLGADKQALAIGVITAAFAAWHQPKTDPQAQLTLDSANTSVIAPRNQVGHVTVMHAATVALLLLIGFILAVAITGA